MSAFTQAVGAILDNYADVIEGGSTYNGGTSYRGIPGVYSNDHGLRIGSDASITASANGSTTVVPYLTGDWDGTRWVKTDATPFFLRATSGSNNKAARKISEWDNTNKRFTVAAFDTAVASGDTFVAMQGFKRLPNGVDIETDGNEHEDGFDRFFQLSLSAPVAETDYGSKTTRYYRATMELRLRLLKYGRAHDIIASAAENMTLLRGILTLGSNPDHRDGTYTVALLEGSEAPEVQKNDGKKLVIADKYQLIYRVDRTYN